MNFRVEKDVDILLVYIDDKLIKLKNLICNDIEKASLVGGILYITFKGANTVKYELCSILEEQGYDKYFIYYVRTLNVEYVSREEIEDIEFSVELEDSLDNNYIPIGVFIGAYRSTVKVNLIVNHKDFSIRFGIHEADKSDIIKADLCNGILSFTFKGGSVSHIEYARFIADTLGGTEAELVSRVNASYEIFDYDTRLKELIENYPVRIYDFFFRRVNNVEYNIVKLDKDSIKQWEVDCYSCYSTSDDKDKATACSLLKSIYEYL